MIKQITRNVRFGIGLAAAMLVANTALGAIGTPAPEPAEGLSFCGTMDDPCRLDTMVVAVEAAPAPHRAVRPVLADAPAPHMVVIVRRHADS
jgi:hypothetical protein